MTHSFARLLGFFAIVATTLILLTLSAAQTHLLGNLNVLNAVKPQTTAYDMSLVQNPTDALKNACQTISHSVETPLEAWCAAVIQKVFVPTADNALNKLQFSQVLLANDKQTEAATILQSVPNADLYYALRGYQFYKDTDWVIAEHSFQLSDQINDTPQIRKFPMYQARCVTLRDKPETRAEAIENCEQVVAYMPTADMQFLLGRAYFEDGQFENAKIAFTQSLKVNETAYGFTWLARAESNIDNSGLVQAYFNKAIELDPTYPWSRAYLGDWLMRENALAEANEAYQITIALENQAAAQYAQSKLGLMKEQTNN